MTSSDAEIFPMTVMVADCRDGGKVRGLGRDHSRGLEFRGVDRVLQAASNETLKLPGGFVHRDHRRAAANSLTSFARRRHVAFFTLRRSIVNAGA